MEASLELEDDVFFADLSRQISLLIMDDDNEDSISHIPSVNLQAFTQSIGPTVTQSSFVNYDYRTTKRENKGTGVFIPHPSHPRRKNNYMKQSKFTNSSNNKFQRPCENNSRGLPNQSFNESFNFRKY